MRMMVVRVHTVLLPFYSTPLPVHTGLGPEDVLFSL